MAHVITQPPAPFTVGGLQITALCAAEDNLVWLLRCLATDAVYAVDGPDAEAVDEATQALGLPLTGILTTHTHHDHIGLHKALGDRLASMDVVGKSGQPIPGLSRPVDDGDQVSVGQVPMDVWLTEGHIEGHVSYVCDGAVFCGDTLFAGGCGYLFQRAPEKMFRSLMRLASLPGETLVCCAHEYTEDNLRFACMVEPDNAALHARVARVLDIRSEGGCTVPSTIEVERATNPFFRPGSPTLRQRLTEECGRAPDDMLDAFTMARTLKNEGKHKTIDLTAFLPK